MATIYDVAAQAGVSASTASRILNGIITGSKNEEKVREAASQLNYLPSGSARRLRLQQSRLIALMVPDIANQFYVGIARVVEDIAQQNGYNLIMLSTDDELAKESRCLRAMVAEPVAGIIAVPSSSASSYQLAVDHSVPVVCIDRATATGTVDSVVMDSYQAAKTCVQSLVQQERTRIACVTGPEGVQTADLRTAGWIDALSEAGIEPQLEQYLIRTDYSKQGGYDALQELLRLPSPPDAIFAANNDLAFGVLRGMVSERVLPPKILLCSLGVVSDHLLPGIQIPYAQEPIEKLAKTAIELLFKRIAGSKDERRDVVVRFGMHLDQQERR